jgi:oxygen-independent coproporphyrinogen-3 oxidase
MAALLKETELQQDYLKGQPIETIYFGGGTPSILPIADLRLAIGTIKNCFDVAQGAEITLEANPDDITNEKLLQWKQIGINRFSIGIQSFFDEDLQWMNRVHSSSEAIDCIEKVKATGFDNYTIDLIYGTPTLSDEKWKANVEKAIALNVPHLSCYALTVEPQTALQKMIALKKKEEVDTERQSTQFLLLMDWLEAAGYEHYEISNFAKPGYRSKHNSSYWQQQHYLGLGPSAHSYNGVSRQWNISNNSLYIQSLKQNNIPFETEELSEVQQLNEYIMTSLRTMEGIDLNYINGKWKMEKEALIKQRFLKYIQSGSGMIQDEKLVLTKKGKLFADGIAADLFFDQ